MSFARVSSALALGAAALIGCSSGSSTTATTTTSTTSTTATTASSTTSTSSSGGGGGGAGGSNAGGGGATTTGTGGSATSGGAGAYPCTGTPVSLANDLIPITKVNCAEAAGCHVPFKTAAGTYQYMVSRLADQCTELRMIVEPGFPERSYVVDKITGLNMCSGESMPKGSPLLSDPEIQLMVDWICEGAPNN